MARLSGQRDALLGLRHAERSSEDRLARGSGDVSVQRVGHGRFTHARLRLLRPSHEPESAIGGTKADALCSVVRSGCSLDRRRIDCPCTCAARRHPLDYAPIVQRAAAIIGSAIFLVIAPGMLAVYVPWYLTHWHFAPPLFPIARVLGAALIVAGLPILLDSFARFALQGLGTPAPVMPPKRLVVTGFYRYVRNPMYVAVTALIAGQGLLFGSVTVLEYGAIVWAGFFLFVVAYEEPALGECPASVGR